MSLALLSTAVLGYLASTRFGWEYQVDSGLAFALVGGFVAVAWFVADVRSR